MTPETKSETEFDSTFEPRLSSDFASRVMREAGRVRTRRRMRRRAVGALAGAAVVFGIYLMPTSRLIPRHPAATQQASATAATEWDDNSDASIAAYAYSNADETGLGSAADYLFPDVESLQDFTDEYATGSSSATDYSTWNAETI